MKKNQCNFLHYVFSAQYSSIYKGNYVIEFVFNYCILNSIFNLIYSVFCRCISSNFKIAKPRFQFEFQICVYN